MTQPRPPSHLRIADARRRIDPVFLNSPLLRHDLGGVTLLAKDETQNPIGSFKGRGTDYYVSVEAPPTGRMVTASAGNFGQGLAYAARSQGRDLTVFASVNASPIKIAAMRQFGAEVILEGEDFDGAKAAGKAYAEAHGLSYVEDGASAAIAEGAGTIAAELTDVEDDIDAIYVPLGNGALAAGIGRWMREHAPKTQVIAVAAKGAPCMALSWQSGEIERTAVAATIADGIAVREPVPVAVEWLYSTIDGVMLVDDAQIIAAMGFAYAQWGRVVEPAGAAGLAGVLAAAPEQLGAKVATVLCGGNLTQEQIKRWLPAAK